MRKKIGNFDYIGDSPFVCGNELARNEVREGTEEDGLGCARQI